MHFAIRYYVCERTHVHKIITVTSEVCVRSVMLCSATSLGTRLGNNR